MNSKVCGDTMSCAGITYQCPREAGHSGNHGSVEIGALWGNDYEAVAAAKCPHCGEVTSFPGFDAIDMFVCPQCGEPVDLSVGTRGIS